VPHRRLNVLPGPLRAWTVTDTTPCRAQMTLGRSERDASPAPQGPSLDLRIRSGPEGTGSAAS
jgi:hypothetical protein